MAIIYNNAVCVCANDLIKYNPKTRIGSDTGFLAEGTYYYKVKHGLLVLMRRASNGRPALIEFDTMEDEIKKKYTETYGNPKDEVERNRVSYLESEMKYNEAAYTFFSTEYRDELGRKLSAEKAALYTLQVRVLDACLSIAHNRKNMVGAGNTRVDIWARLSDYVNDLATVRGSMGELKYPHNLPANAKSLKRKADLYAKEGWSALIHKNRGNRNAVKVADERLEAVMHKLLSQHMNLNNVQIMEKYNEVATLMQMPLIKSPVTVDKYRKQMEATTLGHQRGTKALRNKLEMQVKREAPETALTYWTLDGWDVELIYQKQVLKVGDNGLRHKRTTYDNRKTIVVVLDACCKYPIGYAIGDRECTDLIRTALRNAVKHTKELFGTRYKPLQLQSDNYQKKVMTPFYQAMSKYYTPAAVGNAKSKIIEPYFNEINRDYCQLLPNWSGHNITSNPDNQPNYDAYNKNRKLLPTEDECVAQIHEIMRQERAKKIAAYMAAWEKTPDERKIPFCDEEYLMLMGETTGRTNRLSGQGLMIEMMGERINYESFSFELREHYNEDWVVRYDPDDLSQVLITNAKATKGHRVLEEIGTLAYMMQRTMKVPMALADQKPEHFEYRRKVNEFNKEFERRYVEKQNQVDNTLDSLREELPAIGRNRLLERALITDSKGQHKDCRYEARNEVEDAFIIEEAPRHTFVPVHDDDDDDYEFKPTDMNFSR